MEAEWDFQALTLTEGWEMIRADKAQSQKTLRGQGRLRATKLLGPLTERIPVGIDASPRYLGKGVWSEKWSDHRCHKLLD